MLNASTTEDYGGPSPRRLSDDSGEDDGPPWVIMYIIGAVAGIWCCAITISTRGCRDFRHRDQYYEDNVWVPTTVRDRRLAIQLQREEREAARVEAGLRREQLAAERAIWVKTAAEEQEANFRLTEESMTTIHPSCAICLTDYTLQSVVLQGARCTHVFHKECITAALLQSKDCPVCRQVFLAKDDSAATTTATNPVDSNNNEEENVNTAEYNNEEGITSTVERNRNNDLEAAVELSSTINPQAQKAAEDEDQNSC